jgi:hypothetical protein
MKTKISILLMFAMFSISHSAFQIVPISPYIDKWVSLEVQLLPKNPVNVIHYYEAKTQGNTYSASQNSVYLTEGLERVGTVYVKSGIIKQKLELMAGFWFFSPGSPIYARLKFNNIDIGEDGLFKNLAISHFGGFIYSSFSYNQYVPVYNKNAVMLYSGTAFGTRKKIDDFSYLEIFTSPEFSFTHYNNLGGKYDPPNVLKYGNEYGYDDDKYQKFGLWIPDFNMPIGVGVKYRHFFIKGGLAFSAAIGGKERHLNRNGAFLDKVVVDTKNFSAFLQTGIHFRKFRELGKEANNDGI